MNKKVLKEAGIAEDEFSKMANDWAESKKSMSEEYLQSPEGRLMEAIYGKKKES